MLLYKYPSFFFKYQLLAISVPGLLDYCPNCLNITDYTIGGRNSFPCRSVTVIYIVLQKIFFRIQFVHYFLLKKIMNINEHIMKLRFFYFSALTTACLCCLPSPSLYFAYYTITMFAVYAVVYFQIIHVNFISLSKLNIFTYK